MINMKEKRKKNCETERPSKRKGTTVSGIKEERDRKKTRVEA